MEEPPLSHDTRSKEPEDPLLERLTAPEHGETLEPYHTPVRISEVMPGVELVEGEEFRLVVSAPGKSIDWQIPEWQELSKKPGVTIFLIPRFEDRKRFFRDYPNFSLAVDNFVTGRSEIQETEKELRAVVDHHGPKRSDDDSACLQLFHLLRSGRLEKMRGADGKLQCCVFITHLDGDSKLSAAELVANTEIRDTPEDSPLAELIKDESIIDSAGGAPLDLSYALIAKVAAVDGEDPRVNQEQESCAEKKYRQIESTLRRMRRFAKGVLPPEQLDLRYTVLAQQGDLSVVWEKRLALARKRMAEEGGLKALIVVKDYTEEGTVKPEKDRPGTKLEYTLQNLLPKHVLPLGEAMYGFLCHVDGLDELARQTPAQLEAHLDEEFGGVETDFSRFNPHINGKQPAFGGADSIGGGRTTMRYEVLLAAIQWYLSYRQRCQEADERTLSFVRKEIRQRFLVGPGSRK